MLSFQELRIHEREVYGIGLAFRPVLPLPGTVLSRPPGGMAWTVFSREARSAPRAGFGQLGTAGPPDVTAFRILAALF